MSTTEKNLNSLTPAEFEAKKHKFLREARRGPDPEPTEQEKQIKQMSDEQLRKAHHEAVRAQRIARQQAAAGDQI